MQLYKVLFGSIQLPVAPQKIEMNVSNNNKTMELINGSEINFLRTQGLTEFSFDFLIPNVRYPFAAYPDGFKPPDFYLEMLEQLKTNNKPFPFKILRTMPNGKELFHTRMVVSLEEYAVTEDAGEGFDLIVSVKLKQFREQKTLVNSVVEQIGNIAIMKEEKTRAVEREISKAYTVKKGDSLWKICKVQLGDGSKFGEIAKINGIDNPNLIYPGQVLQLG